MPTPVIEAAAAFGKQMERQDAAAMKRVISAYQSAYGRLQDKIDLLVQQIGADAPTRGQVIRMQRYQSLIAQVTDELKALGVLTRNEVDNGARIGIEMGAKHAREMLSYAATGTPRVAAVFNSLPTAAIQQLLGFLAPESALWAKLEQYAPVHAAMIADEIVSGVALGYNPVKIAKGITKSFGMALTDSMRMMRTVQLWSYREANRATYIANQDVLDGWVWTANLDGLTCMSCVAQHGTVHPVTETLNDHHNGRCYMVPLVKGFNNPVEQTGREWFEKQPEAVQRKMMGKQYHQAWRAGQFDLADLSKNKPDDIYGRMRGVTPLWELLGAEPPVRMHD